MNDHIYSGIIGVSIGLMLATIFFISLSRACF